MNGGVVSLMVGPSGSLFCGRCCGRTRRCFGRRTRWRFLAPAGATAVANPLFLVSLDTRYMGVFLFGTFEVRFLFFVGCVVLRRVLHARYRTSKLPTGGKERCSLRGWTRTWRATSVSNWCVFFSRASSVSFLVGGSEKWRIGLSCERKPRQQRACFGRMRSAARLFFGGFCDRARFVPWCLCFFSWTCALYRSF